LLLSLQGLESRDQCGATWCGISKNTLVEEAQQARQRASKSQLLNEIANLFQGKTQPRDVSRVGESIHG
jgi:hypothetical protein